MYFYRHVLYVFHAIIADTDGLNAALSLAIENRAKLSIVVITPYISKSVRDFQQSYSQMIAEHIDKVLSEVDREIHDNLKSSYDLHFISQKNPGPALCRLTSEISADLVVKAAEHHGFDNGFTALDIHLARKLSVDLLLSQAADKPHPNMKIAVAVDPDEEDQQAINLTINTLQKAERLAEIFTPPIHIIGCWHLPYGMENLLKQHNISLDEHSQTTSSPQKSQSKKALLRIIERAKLSHRITLHHRTGTPTLIVPQFVTDFGIDILILSSPNRHEGDDSLGSTAEDILRLTTCSVLVVKPRVLLSRQFEFG